MFAQEIVKGFLGELLKILHLIPGKEIESLPCLVVELDALAFHQIAPSSLNKMTVTMSDTTIEPRQPTLLEKNKNI